MTFTSANSAKCTPCTNYAHSFLPKMLAKEAALLMLVKSWTSLRPKIKKVCVASDPFSTTFKFSQMQSKYLHNWGQCLSVTSSKCRRKLRLAKKQSNNSYFWQRNKIIQYCKCMLCRCMMYAAARVVVEPKKNTS